MLQQCTTRSYGPRREGPVIAEIRTHLPDDEASSRMALLASGFADPGRIRLLGALAGGAVCVGDLALALSVSQSSVSHQLRLLRSVGIVSSERRGRHIYYRLSWPGAARVLRELLSALEASERWQEPALAGDDNQEEE
ncbi:MAG: ArsR/SmtB family transcription factor [Spirochaetota bacterium]